MLINGGRMWKIYVDYPGIYVCHVDLPSTFYPAIVEDPAFNKQPELLMANIELVQPAGGLFGTGSHIAKD